jgi:hypothetical protein
LTIFFCVARKRREDDAATPLLPACRPSRLPSRPVSAGKTRRNPGSVTPLDLVMYLPENNKFYLYQTNFDSDIVSW